MSNVTERPLFEIGNEIKKDWNKVYFGAEPYLSAMRCLSKTTDSYGADNGKSVVLYFLSNASTYRGETAKRIKAELKKMVGLK